MIQAVAGKRKFRISPDDNCMIQLQPKHGSHWMDYRRAASWMEASKLVLQLAMGPQEETEEVEAVNERTNNG